MYNITNDIVGSGSSNNSITGGYSGGAGKGPIIAVVVVVLIIIIVAVVMMSGGNNNGAGGNSGGNSGAPPAPTGPPPIPSAYTSVGCKDAGTYDSYIFCPGKDSGGNDIQNSGLGNNVPGLISWCDNNAQCKAFNTNAWMKHTIAAPNAWGTWTTDPTKGMYVKRSALA